ncbi:hypothetical protein [Wielerella bovis]|uniref:hypothetical protein n=1 Tax=Wielerella bovis TaxID=2917790 RepID=UPI0020190580|nr:hypothetical protein [Wielerella bovis]ULJ59377.1 hypothetical protein MIS44_06605 [Wielerella bovis]ULJ62248.1 hypothetical protein MIS46_09830 [Wielerella bovis]ULJ63726.1 hypothetical protein MIS33_05980 [Wielerella bovis]ULJ66763.1 hypothetical protein MIS31_11085 [Wielerella bovis]ULJ70091.1 hypothetical protein MIS45_04500 [Wielerella bovis]
MEQKYQMYVIRRDQESTDIYPYTKYWFSAKQWLIDEENYLKVSDCYLIYKKGMKIPDINQDLYRTFLRENELTQEELPYKAFIKEMGSTLQGVYLFSEFDKDTLKPNNHYFLVTFKLKNHTYETRISWEMDKKLILVSGFSEPGTYHRLYYVYTYSDYLKGKPVP